MRASVVVKTVATTAAFLLATWFAARLLSAWLTGPSGLVWALGFAAVQMLAITVLVGIVLIGKTREELRARRSARVKPLVDRTLAAYVTGSDKERAVRRLAVRFPPEFDASATAILAAVAGESAERLAAVLGSTNVVSRWRRQAQSRNSGARLGALHKLGLLGDAVASAVLRDALVDPEPRVRVVAARLLLRNGEPDDVAAVYEFAVRDSLLVQAVVTDELLRHATSLVEKSVPAALASGDRRVVLNALRMLLAWRVAFPAPTVSHLWSHPDGEIRAAAIRLMPFTTPSAAYDELLVEALASSDDNVREAAAFAAGRLRAAGTVPALDACLDADSPAVVIAAARSLARLGAPGTARLEERLAGSNRAAPAALEALEKYRMGTLSDGASG